MPLPPSRRDSAGPPPRKNVSDLSALVRHHQSYLRGMDPGFLDGRFATPQPVGAEPSQILGEDLGGGDSGTDSILFCNTDNFDVIAVGDQTLQLSHIPLDGSLQAFWVPLRISEENWTLSDNVLVVSDPGFHVGDRIEVAYAYEYDGEVEPTTAIVEFGDLDWVWSGALAWSDPVDYHALPITDPLWGPALGAPFGGTTPPLLYYYRTFWPQNGKMWATRTVPAQAGADVIVTAVWNRTLKVWWNGELIVSGWDNHGDLDMRTFPENKVFTIPGDKVLASNQIVFRIFDDGYTGTHTGCWFDAMIEQVEEA